MDRPYVEELHIENYGCIRDATLRLTPLHALIGPNDSGKSTVLRALRTLGFLFTSRSRYSEDEHKALLRVLAANKQETQLAVSSGGATWLVNLRPQSGMRWQSFPTSSGPRQWVDLEWRAFEPLLGQSPAAPFVQAMRGTQLLRLDPDALRAPSPLIPDGQPLSFKDERGTGLPALYDAIVTRDIQAFLEINTEVQRLFPDVKSVSLTNPSSDTKAMGVKLADGTFVPAELMSEGLLYYLAFAALRHMEPTALLLIEEPENGLHPARIAEIMKVLRAISERTQIIIATHSPLVVNELEPHEVSVITRSREHGTRATLMKDTANFEERSKVYALGELWLSYANGEDEKPLLEGGPRP